jgi:hypothetical protein
MNSIVVLRRRWNAIRKSRPADKGFQWIARGMRPLKPGVLSYNVLIKNHDEDITHARL